MKKANSDYSHGTWAGAFYLFSTILFVKSCWFTGNLTQKAIWFVGCAAALGIATVIGRRHAASTQQIRDADAENLFLQLLEAARTSSPPAYFLYLRSFSTTNQIKLWTESRYLGPSVFSQAMDIEVALAHAVAPAPLLGLGSPGEQVGAARILTSEAEWRDAVSLLARQASGILLIPSHRAGTLWEIDMIRQHPDLLSKTIFIMIARGAQIRPLLPSYHARNEWEAARTTLDQSGLHLPPYHWKGLLFTLDHQGNMRQAVEQWDLGNCEKLSQTISHLLG
jgi:hypothetical protein